MAFRKKQQYIIDVYDPDIFCIQECESPENFDNYEYKPVFWTGDNENKGLAVFSKLNIEAIKYQNNTAKYHIPYRFEDLYFICIWAMNDKKEPQNRYIGQVWNIINSYTDLLNGKIIILGDFNWNIYWDEKPDYPLAGNFNDVVEKLSEYQIYSSYHSKYNENFGDEKTPTLYMYKKSDKQYHVDYIFVKDEIKIKNFYIGSYNDWIEYSDHMPLCIEI